LLDLYYEGVITQEVALENATNPADVRLKMSGVSNNENNTVSKPSDDVQAIADDDVFELK
jgi:Tfp pilus assembly ATPase PilU